MALAAVFWWAGWRLARFFSSNLLLAWVWLMLFAGLAGMRNEQAVDIRTTAWALLWLSLYFFVEDKPFTARQLLLALGAGILALVKFTGLIAMVAVVLVISADVVLRRRRFPWIAVVYGAGVLFFWLTAGQHLSLFGPYLRYSFLVAGGYNRAMGLSGPGEISATLWMLAASVTLLILMGYAAWQKYKMLATLPLAGLGALLFLTFKLASVRFQPIHSITTSLQLLVISLACLAIVWPALQNSNWRLRGSCLVVVAGIYLFCAARFHEGYRQMQYPDEKLWVNYAWTLNINNLTAPAKLLHDAQYLEKRNEENLSEIRQAFPLPPIQGTVDVYPWRQAVIFAHKLNYDPRPVIQSYSAYTPGLARINAGHLTNAGAPDNLLFDIDPQDGTYPSLEDGLSWPEMLTRYDISGVNGQFIVLKHAPQPRTFLLTLVTNRLVVFGQTVAIPTNQGAIWATMEIEPTIRGKLASIVYKPAQLCLAVELKGGERRYFKFVPGMAREGFLLSPLVQDKTSFISLAATGDAQNETGLQIISAGIVPATSTGLTADYSPSMRWQFYRLEFPPQNPGSAPSQAAIPSPQN